MWNSSRCDSKCNRSGKTDDYSNSKTFSSEKHLIDKLVLTCED